MTAPNKSSDVQSENITSPSPALSPTSTLFENSPRSPIRHRPTFTRLASVLDGDTRSYEAVKGDDEITEAPLGPEEEPTVGLGISHRDKSAYESHRAFSGSTLRSKTDISHDAGAGKDTNVGDDLGSPYWSSQGKAKPSVTSFQSSLRHSYTASNTQLIQPRQSFADTLRTTYDDFSPGRNCAAREHFHHSCSSWPTIIILILSVYSTAFSALYLIVAATGPRYGKGIGSNGRLSSESANTLTALFAKTIEISFATVFVTFLGQVLWRKAFARPQRRGVTLAEMDMRSWVMQPGTMLTHFGAMRSSALTVLGLLTLVSAFISLLYTTASDTLVQPQLKYGNWEPKSMQGLVKTSWGNSGYLSQQCASPTKDLDAEYGATTCTQIEHAAQAFHNYQRYLADWAARAQNDNASKVLSERPQGFALLFENTTVTGQWIEQQNVSELVNGRIINNISMAMPHAAITSAAKDRSNGILQPEDLDNLGLYSLHASLWSPAINVLCANMIETELIPIVFDMWNSTPLDPALWVDGEQSSLVGPDYINNKTVVDDIFGWGPGLQMPPVFGKLPLDYNTILNHTGPYGRESIYLLGKGAPTSTDYVVCSIKAFESMACSSRYNVSSSGAQLEAICERDDDEMQYIRKIPLAQQGNTTINKDWVEGAGEWGNSIMLNNGLIDGDASNARLLTQLIMTIPTSANLTLNPLLPSPAEALAVMAGSTLVMGTLDAQILPFWNYSVSPLDPGRYESFEAKLRGQQYASGGNKKYQLGFLVVFALVFVINVVCLAYFLIYRGLNTDYSEPVNLFSLAINSPPSDLMAGTCGGGPQRKQYGAPWYVNAAGDHLYMESVTMQDDQEAHEMRSSRSSPGEDYADSPMSPILRALRRLSKQASFV